MHDCQLVSANAPDRSVKQPAANAGADSPRVARLLKHSDFERVYKQGQRLFSSHMTVFYLCGPGPVSSETASPGNSSPGNIVSRNHARVGFTVGRVLGGAVKRNRIKRRMREAVRLRGALLAHSGSVDIVMNPKKSVLTVDFSVLLEDVGRALETISKKLILKAKQK